MLFQGPGWGSAVLCLMLLSSLHFLKPGLLNRQQFCSTLETFFTMTAVLLPAGIRGQEAASILQHMAVPQQWKWHGAERLSAIVQYPAGCLLWLSIPNLTILNRNHRLSGISASPSTMTGLFHCH